MAARCSRTLDLLGSPLPELAIRFDDPSILGAPPRVRLLRGINRVLTEARERRGIGREDVCAQISSDLGEAYTIHRLNADTAETAEAHTISAVRLGALCRALDDWRPLSLLADPQGVALVPAEHLDTVRVAALMAQRDRIDAQLRRLRALVPGGRR